jgi:hypothetical protein
MLVPEKLNPAPRNSSNISAALRAIPANDPGLARPAEAEVLVRPVRDDAELDCVYRITHDAFVERAYCAVQPDGRLIHYPHLDHIAETTVLVAIVDGQIVGTNSWTLDGPQGLHVDSDFKTECDAIRREGRRLSSSWRIATTSKCRSERKVVMALIQETLVQSVEAGVLTSLFTFNPRHERIYRHLLNMQTVARNDGTRGLNNAPAVLMRLDRENIPEVWLQAAAAGQPV